MSAAAGRAASPALRRLLGGRQPLGVARLRPPSQGRLHQQRRWAQVHDVRFLATTQAPRHVLERYRLKLDRKAQDEGHGDISALKEAYADKIKAQRLKDHIAVPGLDRLRSSDSGDATATAAAEGSQIPTTRPPPAEPLPQQTAPPPPTGDQATAEKSQVQPLSAILDLEKARELPVAELTAIWRLRHASSPLSLCAVIPASTYAAMETLARTRPQFVLPVPHPSQGAEIHFLQWTFDRATRTSTVLFTQLAEYKARGEFAQPHTTVTHHADFAADKGVVLMHGSVVENRGVPIADAQFLVMCLQRFYGGWDAATAGAPAGPVIDDASAAAAAAAAAGVDGRAVERRRLLEWFSAGDPRFSVEKLMEETERLG